MTHEPGNLAIDLTPESAGRLLRLAEATDEYQSSQEPPIPGYRVLGLLGEGGAGRVYLAQREGAPDLVALKVFRTRLDTEERQRRAWREIDLLSTLRLPCVPRIVGWGVDDGTPWIASEFIEGQHLDDAARRIDRRARVALLARVAEAVQEVHARGIIHRDLKPTNVLVTDRGDPVIIDFGLAAEGGAPVQTLDDTPRGTLGFMAPEQARGERYAITTRTDVFALGATAMLLLTGQGPHAPPTTLHEGLRCAADEPARDPRTIDPSLDRALSAVLAKAVAFAPEDRYVSAAEFAADLRRWLVGEPVAARPAGSWLRFARWIGRHPIAATASACATMVALTLGGTAGYLAWWNAQHRTPARIEFTMGQSKSVQIISRSGVWWGAVEVESGSVADAQLVPGAGEDGVPLLLVGTIQGDATGAREIMPLRAFSLGSEGPALQWKAGPEAYPAWAKEEYAGESREATFTCRAIRVADVFPERDGPEVVAVFQHTPYSQTMIAVLTLEGERLFDVWHDGHVYGIVWDDASGLLICAGVNSDGEWKDRMTEKRPVHADQHPPVLFAVRPREGEHGKDIRPGHPRATADAVWYRCLQPSANACQFRFYQDAYSLGPPVSSRAGNGERSVATARLVARDPDSAELGGVLSGAEVHWEVTAMGVMTRRPLTDVARDLFEELANGDGAVPRPLELEWGDLPAKLR